MTEAALDKKQIIAELTKSAHGDMETYLKIGQRAALEDPNFFAHLVAWNHVKGQVRDAKIALPVISLAMARQSTNLPTLYEPIMDNALAHIADLRPQELKRIFLESTRMTPDPKDNKKKIAIPVPPFAITANAPKRVLRRLVTRYLRDLEADRRQFEYTAVQHSNTLHTLYARFHVDRPQWVGEILFHGEKGKEKIHLQYGIFDAIHRLHLMDIEEAAGTIVRFKIPFLIARGALGKKAKEPDTVLALIKSMSPAELVTNMKWLEKLGVKTNPVLRAALDLALGKAATSKRATATLKTTRAAEALKDDDALSGKLQVLQEKQLDKLGGIEGDWLVLGDKSGSMQGAIDVAMSVSSILARMVKGNVHLIFFDQTPRYFNVTGKSLEEIKYAVGNIGAVGGTYMHCGIQYAIDKKLRVDGMVFVSDGANHGIPVPPVYQKYCQMMDIEPTLYFYQLAGEPDSFSRECRAAGIDLQTFDLRGQSVDYYSLPNLAQTMRVSRYSLMDEVMETPLRTLDEVLDKTKGMSVLPRISVSV